MSYRRCADTFVFDVHRITLPCFGIGLVADFDGSRLRRKAYQLHVRGHGERYPDVVERTRGVVVIVRGVLHGIVQRDYWSCNKGFLSVGVDNFVGLGFGQQIRRRRGGLGLRGSSQNTEKKGYESKFHNGQHHGTSISRLANNSAESGSSILFW